MGRHSVFVRRDICRNCHRCISVCPVKTCNNARGDAVEVIPERCIGCGACIAACKAGAREVPDDWVDMMSALRDGRPVVAIVAPSAVAHFGSQLLRVNGLLQRLGVEAVFDVSFGAELTVRSLIEHLRRERPQVVVAHPCAAIVNFLQTYKPELLPHLPPILSPMGHSLRMIRHFFPQYARHAVAVISPCLAKKQELIETELGDFNVGIRSVIDYLNTSGTRLEGCPSVPYTNPDPQLAVLFPLPGGLTSTLHRWAPDLAPRVRRIEGPSTVYTYLDSLATNRDRPASLFVDCLSCSEGCVGGPLTPRGGNIEMSESLVEDRCDTIRDAPFQELAAAVEKYWKPGLYAREFRVNTQVSALRVPDEEDTRRIFAMMGKVRDDDIYDCSSCGYNSCQGMALAIANELNRPTNCHHYLLAERESQKAALEENESRLRTILETSLEGFLRVDRQGRILETNHAMAEILGTEIVDRFMSEFLDEDNKRVLQTQIQLRGEGKRESYELTFTAADGRKIDCLLQGAPLWHDGVVVGSFAMVTDITARKRADKEIRDHRDALEREVARRTKALVDAHESLQHSFQQLKDTQHQLVESEKLAALARLVAGVAHEINTPVGIGVTAASFLQEKTAHFQAQFRDGKMKRSDLEGYVRVAVDSVEILLANLRRAGELIANFKRVAVDQSSHERRGFDLQDYLKGILLSVNPKLKKTKHTVQIDCAEGIQVDTYPGALSQVITNLIMNSLVHGFDDNDAGRILLAVEVRDGAFILLYRDDGKGIAEQNVPRIFEPFFTTKRGQGGSGLGLHIVHNLVTQTLGGSIACESQIGVYTQFTLRIPLRAPERKS